MWQLHLPLLASMTDAGTHPDLILTHVLETVQQSQGCVQSKGANSSAPMMIPRLASELDELVYRACRRVIRAKSHCMLKEIAVSSPCHDGGGCDAAA